MPKNNDGPNRGPSQRSQEPRTQRAARGRRSGATRSKDPAIARSGVVKSAQKPGGNVLKRPAASRAAAAAGQRGPVRDGTRQPKKPRQGSRSRKGRSHGVVRFALRAGVTLALLLAVVVGAIIAYYASTLPPRSEWAVPTRPPNVAILSQRGRLIANRGDTGGKAVTLGDLPSYVPNAVLAIEDRRFYAHPGIDPIGLTRAMLANLKAGRLVQGGSTVTQQLAKNLFTDASRTLERKIQEMILAMWLEIQFEKDEILQMYLNRVYLGAGAYGVDAAARRYFSKPAEELELAEAAVIAGLLKAPTTFAPTTDLERSNARAATVLLAMQDAGFITPAERAYALENPATLKTPTVAESGGYVADWVAEVLPGFAGAVTEDVIVETTIDLELQELAQSALDETLAREGDAKGVDQGAVVVLDGSGAVKALVGGRSYEESQFNRAVSARRQPGSAFKPFVYLAALEHGLSPATIRIDQPTRIGNWTPENYTKEYYGPVSLSKALALSLNTIAAQLTNEVGAQSVAETARRLGVRSPLEPNGSIALGTSEVTLLELTTAYVPFSNGGVGVIPHVVRRIKTRDGKLLYDRRGSGPGQVVDDADAGAINFMLSQALTSGTARRAALDGWQAAGKTGTSQNWRDAWFVGYTAYFTAGVWFGNDDNSPTKKATGGSLPADLWKRLMEKVHEGMVPAELPGASTERVAFGHVPTDAPWDSSISAAPARTAAPMTPRDAGGRLLPEPAGDGGFFRRLFGG